MTGLLSSASLPCSLASRGLLRQHCEPTTTGHTLSAAQLRYLYLLEHAGAPQPISYFADGVFSNRSNATQMIDRLQGEGLVSRIKNPRDRRSVLVELTELGSQRLREGNEWLVGLLEALFDPLGDEERERDNPRIGSCPKTAGRRTTTNGSRII